MGRYGWKIKNYKAATIVAKNMGLRDKYDYTEAMLHHSLFTRWLKKHGMKTDKKDESTRDIICIDFQFGLRSYTEEIAHVKKMRKAAEDRGDIEGLDGYFDYLDQLEDRINSNKDKYIKYSKDDIRRMLYEEGANITYSKVNKHTGEITEETVKYLMLYRNPSKAKQGSCMFIREELYDKAYDWLTMGIGKMLPDTGAKIVEISAYAPLSTSAIEDTLEMNVEDVLIVEDQDSFLRTTADVVSAADYNVDCRVLDEEHFKKTGKRKYKKETVTKQRCIVERKEIDVKNTLWDGQALIDSSILPEFCNGMALLRNHFFKACAFKTNLQLFFLDYCQEHGIDYETFTLTDMFGVNHLAKNIKMITTNNAIKWIKSSDVISGGNKLRAYKYWKRRVKADGNVWGIVKTDHKSKLGNVQQMSYQMVNTLPCSKEDVHKIAQTSIDYVNALKHDNELFSEFLTANATEVNHYEMLNALYHWNPDFAKTKLWKTDKSKIINSYVNKLRKGKIFVDGDNLTVCGNPYALLLHTVGEDWNSDPTLQQENDCIQVYTTRFADGEYLCGIRSPHNGMQNLAYFKNHHHQYFRRYFDFSNNIMAVNCICTDVQCRLNGEDFDSDFNFVTNQPQMVEAARIAYRDYPTSVNEVPESSIVYNNTKADYAIMDSSLQGAQKAIGGSSDSAQLALSYYWTEIYNNGDPNVIKQLYENVVVLAQIAQIAIDSTKRSYSVNPNEDIQRIRSQSCMKRVKDYPKFMQYTHEVPFLKNGNERSQSEITKDRKKLRERIDNTLVCPMNWLEECLNKIQGLPNSDDYCIDNLFIRDNSRADYRKIGRVRALIEEYDKWIKTEFPYYDHYEQDNFLLLSQKQEEVIEAIKNTKLSKASINHLIGAALQVENYVNKQSKKATKLQRKMLNLLYKHDPEKFLNCFLKKNVTILP